MRPLRVVVRRPNVVSFRVCELQLDHIGWKPELIEKCARHVAKPMPGLLFAGVTNPPQSGKNLRAVPLLLGHSKTESTDPYRGIEVDNAQEVAERT